MKEPDRREDQKTTGKRIRLHRDPDRNLVGIEIEYARSAGPRAEREFLFLDADALRQHIARRRSDGLDTAEEERILAELTGAEPRSEERR